jgi:NhaP-type Na+/H+ or K+/H+ antiporter
LFYFQVNITQSGLRLIKTNCTTPASPNIHIKGAEDAPLLIPWNIMHMVSYVGMRGIVSFSCANIFNNTNGNREEMIAVTASIAFMTLFIQGGFTTSMIKLLNIPTNVEANPSKVLVTIFLLE